MNMVISMEHSKITAAKLIKDKLEGKNFMTYKEIAYVTNYHPKYILKLKKRNFKWYDCTCSWK